MAGALLAYPLFVLLSTGTESADLQGVLVIALFAAMVSGAAPAAYVDNGTVDVGSLVAEQPNDHLSHLVR